MQAASNVKYFKSSFSNFKVNPAFNKKPVKLLKKHERIGLSWA